MESLLNLDQEKWRQEMQEIGIYLEEYGSRLPQELLEQQRNVLKDLA
jgi:GTP-dependent phosphoenolpyruvate carboxykinase